MPNSLQPSGPYPSNLLCPWDSPGKNTEVGCHALLISYTNIFKILYLIILLLDFHMIFLKTGKKINITEFQKVEFFSFCDSVIHIHIYYFLNYFPL